MKKKNKYEEKTNKALKRKKYKKKRREG